jgi:hypothetical protein
MKYKFLSKLYDVLEQEVHEALRNEIENSTETSDHIDTKVLNVNIFDYEELAIINDHLTFIDSDGLYYNSYSDCNLEDLIDILNKL